MILDSNPRHGTFFVREYCNAHVTSNVTSYGCLSVRAKPLFCYQLPESVRRVKTVTGGQIRGSIFSQTCQIHMYKRPHTTNYCFPPLNLTVILHFCPILHCTYANRPSEAEYPGGKTGIFSPMTTCLLHTRILRTDIGYYTLFAANKMVTKELFEKKISDTIKHCPN